MAGSDRDLEWLMAPGKDVLLVVVLPLVNPFFLFRWPELRIYLDMDVTLNKITCFIISTEEGPQKQVALYSPWIEGSNIFFWIIRSLFLSCSKIASY